nr:ABC transporter ATP-binding protein [Glycomyces sp. L485]
MEAPDERPEPGGGRPWPGRTPGIDADGLTLTLEGHRVLDEIALRCPAGGLTVVVGGSGAGKSTLLECLAGLVRPDSGAIAVDGVPLEAIGREGTADRVAAVWQTPLLVRGTVLDNLRLGRPGLDSRRCAEALDAVGLGERIRTLPHGEDTVLGDDIALSGGERQRLCLARALAAEPDLLILDEPSSWIDRTNAALIDRAVAELRAECTVVRADHRLEVALAADHVVVLDRGRVVDSGPPGRLRASGGPFAALLDARAEPAEAQA